jgi:hypothetical protein
MSTLYVQQQATVTYKTNQDHLLGDDGDNDDGSVEVMS